MSHSGYDRAIFGALVQHEVIGTVGIFKEERPKTEHKAMIWGMYVDVEYRKQHVGAKLLDIAIQFAKDEMNVKVLGLSLESKNQAAKKLYDSRGFQCWGVERYAMKEGSIFYDEDHMSLVF